MTYLLDTNFCVQHLRQRAGIRSQERLKAKPPSEVVLCSVVRAELVYGAMRGQNPTNGLAEVERFCSRFASVPFDDVAADHYGRIRAELTRVGKTIGPNDLMIAAIARAKGLILVTHNTSEFVRVSDLEIEDWEIEDPR